MDAHIETEHAYLYGQAGTQFDLDEEVVTVPVSGLLIADCCLKDMNQQGKGYGKELYRKALAEYGVLYSLFPVSADALNIHESLVRSGLARIELVDNAYGMRALVRI